MEDNKQKFKKPNDALNKIIYWSNYYPSIEICGFLGYDPTLNEYIVQLEDNCSSDPKNYFVVDALNYLLFKQKYSVLAIFHSHIVGDENPSEFDIKMSENCCVPFLVYSLNSKKFKIHEPINIEYDVNMLNQIKRKL